MTRQQANFFILNKIAKAIDEYPDLRFHQLLINMDILMYEPHDTSNILLYRIN